ncbi:hypothetical protein AXG93_136s1080 [Marchantia polymorpha subsp. ruderalis]|uniref:Uncharacterized protein n=1 Tax=Marchantia polymorpha subsp. ruderalis TaxID=1480154 RepID=A0A176W601_MARPO|nr:hypothetical protein AXG93_136s1080 [Marchantia polymorpha subsp. ruderalis]
MTSELLVELEAARAATGVTRADDATTEAISAAKAGQASRQDALPESVGTRDPAEAGASAGYVMNRLPTERQQTCIDYQTRKIAGDYVCA